MSEEATLDEFVTTENTPISDSPNGVRLALDEVYPEDWGFAELNSVCKVNSGFTWNKEQETDSSEEGAVPVIKIGNVQDGYLDLTDTLYLKGVSDEELEKNKVRKDWLLMIGSNGSGERVGHSGLIEEDMEFVYASFLYGLRANAKYIIPRYLFYTLNRPNVQQRLTSFTAGSTSLKNLNKSTIENLSLPTPPLPEQRKIATVLYTVDRAIEKTEEIKQQVERVRNGVRQDVFLRGVRETGTERTDDELKETYLGAVPEDWQLRRVDEVCPHVVDCPHSTPNYSEEGTPVVRTSEIDGGRYYPAESPRVDEEGYQKRISRLEPEPGDVVFTREAPIGEAFKIPEDMRLCLGQRLMQLRPEEGVLDADFLVELLYSDMMQSWFERSARGSTSTHVNVGDIEKMEIPVPSIEEQHRIVEVLGGFRKQLDAERNLLSRFDRLKRGLMQDLLSGTVRTTDTNIEVPDKIEQYG